MKQILISPLRTEKSTQLQRNGWYAFVVAKTSGKKIIASYVETQFKVHVESVKTIMMHGKTKRVGKKRLLTKSADFKKALVKIKSGEKIALFEGEVKA